MHSSSRPPLAPSPRALAALVAVAAFVAADTAAGASMNDRPAPPSRHAWEPSLQETLDGMTWAGPGIDAVDDQTGQALFTGNGDSTLATLHMEIAGYRDTTGFGVYRADDPAQKAELFSGADGSGTQAGLQFLADGSVRTEDGDFAGFGDGFGFYVDVYGDDDALDYTLYSEDDRNPGGSAQALVYRGDGETTLGAAASMPGDSGGLFGENDYLLAFEDLVGGDDDFQDLVALVSGLAPMPVDPPGGGAGTGGPAPVPEPGSILLVGLGCLGAGLARSRWGRRSGAGRQ